MGRGRRHGAVRTKPLPKFAIVAGSRVDIELRTEKQDPLLKTRWGYFDPAANKIIVSRRATNDTRWWIYHHELGHAWLHRTGCMFLLQQMIPIKDPAVWELIEEVIVRDGMVPHSLSLRE